LLRVVVGDEAHDGPARRVAYENIRSGLTGRLQRPPDVERLLPLGARGGAEIAPCRAAPVARAHARDLADARLDERPVERELARPGNDDHGGRAASRAEEVELVAAEIDELARGRRGKRVRRALGQSIERKRDEEGESERAAHGFENLSRDGGAVEGAFAVLA